MANLRSRYRIWGSISRSSFRFEIWLLCGSQEKFGREVAAGCDLTGFVQCCVCEIERALQLCYFGNEQGRGQAVRDGGGVVARNVGRCVCRLIGSMVQLVEMLRIAGNVCPAGFGLLCWQSVDGIEQMMNGDLGALVDGYVPVASAGCARAQCTITMCATPIARDESSGSSSAMEIGCSA